MNDLNCSRTLSVRWLACCLRLPLALPVLTAVLVLATPAAVQAQFNYTVDNQMVISVTRSGRIIRAGFTAFVHRDHAWYGMARESWRGKPH
jgi:hypothetical protein